VWITVWITNVCVQQLERNWVSTFVCICRSFFFFFLAILGFELRSSLFIYLRYWGLNSGSSPLATLPALFVIDFF
jgi:hypothetical protein